MGNGLTGLGEILLGQVRLCRHICRWLGSVEHASNEYELSVLRDSSSKTPLPPSLVGKRGPCLLIGVHQPYPAAFCIHLCVKLRTRLNAILSLFEGDVQAKSSLFVRKTKIRDVPSYKITQNLTRNTMMFHEYIFFIINE